jgi:cyanophycinase
LMAQQVVLQGGGPFTANDDFDAQILRAHPGYVAVLPTAEAFENPDDLVQLSVAWAKRLGVTTKLCAVYSRADAREESFATIIAQSAVVYVVGDSPIHLRSTLKDTVVFDAVAAHTCVVAAAGSAAAMCDPMVDPRGGAFALGLGLVSGVAAVTESEKWPDERLQRTLGLANTSVAEIPTGAALIYQNGTWSTHGAVVLHGPLPTS